MARVAALSIRPPESIAATTPAIAEVAAEVMAMANYALVTSRQIVFDLEELVPSAFGGAGSNILIYYVPVWLDEDIRSYELVARADVTTPGDAVRLRITNGVVAHDTNDMTSVLDLGTATWLRTDWAVVTSGQAQHQALEIHMLRSLGTGAATLRNVKLWAVTLAPANIPASGE